MKKTNLTNATNTHEILRGMNPSQNDSKNESGRSMTEMLGVLAVMGVLSVGGISGYTAAMRKHRANEIVSQLNMMAHECSRFYTLQGQTGDCAVSDLGLSELDYAAMPENFVAVAGAAEMKADIGGLEKELCTAVQQRLSDWAVAAVSDSCTSDTGNTITVQFKNDLTAWGEGETPSTGAPAACDPACTGNNYCDNGTCKACGEGQAPNADRTACVKDYTDTACSDQADCGGEGSGYFCYDNTYQCTLASYTQVGNYFVSTESYRATDRSNFCEAIGKENVNIATTCGGLNGPSLTKSVNLRTKYQNCSISDFVEGLFISKAFAALSKDAAECTSEELVAVYNEVQSTIVDSAGTILTAYQGGVWIAGGFGSGHIICQ